MMKRLAKMYIHPRLILALTLAGLTAASSAQISVRIPLDVWETRNQLNDEVARISMLRQQTESRVEELARAIKIVRDSLANTSASVHPYRRLELDSRLRLLESERHSIESRFIVERDSLIQSGLNKIETFASWLNDILAAVPAETQDSCRRIFMTMVGTREDEVQQINRIQSNGMSDPLMVEIFRDYMQALQTVINDEKHQFAQMASLDNSNNAIRERLRHEEDMLMSLKLKLKLLRSRNLTAAYGAIRSGRTARADVSLDCVSGMSADFLKAGNRMVIEAGFGGNWAKPQWDFDVMTSDSVAAATVKGGLK